MLQSIDKVVISPDINDTLPSVIIIRINHIIFIGKEVVFCQDL